MRILLWHVHGGWTDALVRGGHEYLLPTTPARDGWGLGRGGRDWPAVEIDPAALRDTDVDVVVLQRPAELAEAERLLGRRPGRDVPAIYVEHNTPREQVPNTVHPLADRDDITVVHVTHVNDLLWDCGAAPTTVIEHGVVDPGYRYSGTLPRIAAVINEPVRRGRVTGTDLLPRFAAVAPLDVYGMGTERLPTEGGRIAAGGDLSTEALREAMAKRRLYLHPMRWTSLGLSLIEAMHLGMPVVALAMTDAARAVPPEAGVVSADVDELIRVAARLIADPAEALERGRAARTAALARYSLNRFLADWDALLTNTTGKHPGSAAGVSTGRARERRLA
ncbi:glycosyltransferase [uncultured Amnibacterium sp.]|uniref:glycosyltransferase n=1 Tax=uncultured Amnibacterium sp. TaxID=1631851 RepID=UPI0035CAF2B2